MDVELNKTLIEAIGQEKLAAFGIDKEKNYYSAQSIDLRRHNTNSIKKLRDLIEPHRKLKGSKAIHLLSDIGIWLEAAANGVKGVKCKNTKHFAALAHEFLQTVAKHWLYCKDKDHDLWAAFYVEEITFHEKKVSRDGVTPARTRLDLYYIELDHLEHTPIDVEDWECRGKTVIEVLNECGYLLETPELLAQYETDRERFLKFYQSIGKQFLAEGQGIDNLDGNRSYWSTSKLPMVRNGEPSRVVIDVKREDEKEEKEGKRINRDYWRSKSYLTADADDDPDEIEPGDEETENPSDEPLVPLFPTVPVFDLKRHARLRVHMRNLTEYVYDKKLGDKLVLQPEIRSMVDMLVQHKGGFRDIIGGKGGGATILCAGPPGVGKTLTAEIYAEVDERALYSVQCSQLGTDPEKLEESLLKAFSRAQRWNAILLLDEADVYVAARGSNLEQNAIVGVFLRVLEYYSGVLFMTTNRADLVDDAIASRCIARLSYSIPSREDLRKIWRILADVMGVSLTDDQIVQITHDNPRISGRDVKNLLKLATLIAAAHNQPVTPEVIKYVKRFKPTEDVEKGPSQQYVRDPT
jgi:DNA polymerase III delta prime subunit